MRKFHLASGAFVIAALLFIPPAAAQRSTGQVPSYDQTHLTLAVQAAQYLGAERVIDMILSASFADPRGREIMAQVDRTHLRDLSMIVIAEHLSKVELAKLLKFMQDPDGQKAVDAIPSINAEIAKMVEQEVIKAVDAYKARQQGKGPKRSLMPGGSLPLR